MFNIPKTHQLPQLLSKQADGPCVDNDISYLHNLLLAIVKVLNPECPTFPDTRHSQIIADPFASIHKQFCSENMGFCPWEFSQRIPRGLNGFDIFTMAVCQNLVPLVNIKIAGKWMFISLKMYLLVLTHSHIYPPVSSNLHGPGATQIRHRGRSEPSLGMATGNGINIGVICLLVYNMGILLEWQPLVL